MLRTALQHILAAFFLLAVTALPVETAVQTGSVQIEYKVKAGFIVNFAKFLRWPDKSFTEKNSPMIIGVMGRNPFDGMLKQVEKKSIQGRPVRVVYIDQKEQLDQCHLVFIADSEREDLGEILSYSAEKPMVTIGDVDGFAMQGGIIEFVNVGNRLGFIINTSEADARSIEVPANLLNLAVKRY